MTRSITVEVTARHTAQTAATAREFELTRLLETGAHFAREWHAVQFLLVDRTGNDATADIKACLAGGRLVDLWDLNPILWDDVHWAAIRLFEAGQSGVVRPVLHRD
jgi:hypothetical protein